VLSVGGVVILFFLYDASTYNEDVTHSDVPVPERALNPRRGGPKNLPIVDCLLDDSDSLERERQRDKPRLVILGSGWGVSTFPPHGAWVAGSGWLMSSSLQSVALLKTLNPDEYHVTVVSPTK
jgi:NADH dehydrogenase